MAKAQAMKSAECVVAQVDKNHPNIRKLNRSLRKSHYEVSFFID